MMQVMKRSSLNKNLAIALVSYIASSCSSPTPFEAKYGEEIKKINSSRLETVTEKKEVTLSSPPSPEEIAASLSKQDNSNKYSYVDVDKFAEKKYFPDKDYYEQMKVYNPSNILADDIFVPRYNTVLASKFHHTGSEFDRIKTPAYDAYSISAILSNKNYVMIGNDAMQNSIDIVNDSRDRRDLLASKIIIKEQREIKQKQRMEKYFGDNDSPLEIIGDKDNIAKEKKDEKAKSSAAKKTDKSSAINDSGDSNINSPLTKRIIKN